MPPRLADYAEHLEVLRAAALRAADPAEAVRRHLKPADVADVERVFIVGAGKAGVAMAQAAVEIAGAKLAGGVVAVPQLPRIGDVHGEQMLFLKAGHPLPNIGSLGAGQAIAQLLSQTTPRDLVLALISGGGSALMELPKPGLSLSDLQITNNLLLKCGATIHELNAVRKALSQIKGGGLLRLAAPAHVLGLILSDVVGNDLATIASGPTLFAPAEQNSVALEIIDRYQLQEALPPSVIPSLIQPSAPIRLSETQSVENRLIASNRQAGEAAAQAAHELGFTAKFIGDDWQGEARAVGQRFTQQLLASRHTSPITLIAGGESTVTVRGTGKGGRNQEVALAAAIALDGKPNLVISTFGTDGVDGPTDAAGATVMGKTVSRARALGLEPQTFLDNNDAYNFFAALGDLVLTGPTGTNVTDLIFGLRYG